MVTRISDILCSRQFDQYIFNDGLLGHNLEHRNASLHSTKPVDSCSNSNGGLCHNTKDLNIAMRQAIEKIQPSNKDLPTEPSRDSATQTEH